MMKAQRDKLWRLLLRGSLPRGRLRRLVRELDVDSFAKHLLKLHAQRRKAKKPNAKKQKAKIGLAGRKALTRAARAEILRKTRRRCHICGGKIKGDKWHADHVFAYIKGGTHQEDNYLPAHSVCNNLRWHYEAEEFQWILKLGVFMRTQIARKTRIGRDTGEKFVDHERRLAGRRK